MNNVDQLNRFINQYGLNALAMLPASDIEKLEDHTIKVIARTIKTSGEILMQKLRENIEERQKAALVENKVQAEPVVVEETPEPTPPAPIVS